MDFASNTRNTRGLGVAGLATLFALLSGCFTEPVGSDPAATGGNCDPGTFSCECFEGSCEPDLRCTASNVCITANCTPGTSVCECDAQGRCGPGLQCMGNVCFPQTGTTFPATTSDTSTSTSGTSTTMPSTTMPSTTMPSTTMPSTTDVDTTTTTDPDTTDATESATTDEPLGCAESRETCGECFSCTDENECESLHTDCAGEPGCITLAACVRACAVDGLCFENCCDGQSANARTAALALELCREDACIAGACRSYATIECD